MIAVCVEPPGGNPEGIKLSRGRSGSDDVAAESSGFGHGEAEEHHASQSQLRASPRGDS